MHGEPTIESKSTAIQRDYWRLAMAAAQGTLSHVLVQGRRRITESYWPGLQLPLSLFERLRRAVHQSCRVAAAYPMAPVAAQTWFPTRELLAVCHGPGYVLELAVYYDGRGKRSLDIVISDPAAGLRPCVYLVDEERTAFAADLDQLAAAIEEAADQYSGAASRPA